MKTFKGLPISVIILNYNDLPFLKKCISHILKSTSLPKEIIVVDNNSDISPTDSLETLFRGKETKIRIQLNSKNLGFAKAVNQGVKMANESNILLINPDLFVGNKTINELWHSYKTLCKKEQTDKIILGGLTQNTENGNIYPTATNKPNTKTLLIEFTSLKKLFDFLGKKNFSNFWNLKAHQKKSPQKVFSVSGCLLLCPRKVFTELKFLDENFFLYLEDLDFGWRAYNQNIPTFFIPTAIARHIGGGSHLKNHNKINILAWNQSKRYFTKKHFPNLEIFLNIIYSIDDLIIKVKKNLVSNISLINLWKK